jgi:hypothetical protein
MSTYRIYGRFSVKHQATIDLAGTQPDACSLLVEEPAYVDGAPVARATVFLTREHALILRAALDAFIAQAPADTAGSQS